MELELLKAIINGYYEYNRVPVFVTKGGKIVFQTIPQHMVSERAEGFLAGLDNKVVSVFGEIEYYTAMDYNDEYKILVGPVFGGHPMTIGYSGRLALENIIKSEYLKDYMLTLAHTGEENFIEYITLIAKMTGNDDWDCNVMVQKKSLLRLTLDKSLAEYVFETRENLLSPYAPATEKRILEMVKAGDVDGVKKVNTTLAVDAPGQSVSYLFKVVSLVALCTRVVVETGVDATVAYGLSDLYLDKLGKASSNKQISDIAKNILPHFALLALEGGQTSAKYSPHLIKAEKYIKAHLHYKLALEDVAKEVGVSQKYLSRLFITHKGVKFTAYVNRARIAEAKALIVNTDHSLTEISYSLGFVSESYFIKIFGELCGTTPNAYRRQYKDNK